MADYMLQFTGAQIDSALAQVASKCDKPQTATSGNVAQFDSNKNVVDSGHALSEYATASALTTHTSDEQNPHSVTKAQVGLGNVDNTSDADKPISSATQSALDGKMPKVASATDGHIATFDENGNVEDSTIAISALSSLISNVGNTKFANGVGGTLSIYSNGMGAQANFALLVDAYISNFVIVKVHTQPVAVALRGTAPTVSTANDVCTMTLPNNTRWYVMWMSNSTCTITFS